MSPGSSAKRVRPGPSTAMQAIWRTPYDRYSPSELLEHYRTRTDVQYFPVPDPEETRREKIDAILDQRFELNSEVYYLPDPVPWRVNPSQDLEWQILLHKFYFAVGLGMAFSETGDVRYRDRWIALTASWMDCIDVPYTVSPRMAPDASQVTGRRIQNWIYAYYYFVEHDEHAGMPMAFHRRYLECLHAQVEHLAAHLSPARNHRTLELYAVFLAAVAFPELRNAGAWLAFSLREIVKNMESDLLPDGVHCELSTDYHHLVLKNYLCVRRLAKLNRIEVPARMDASLIRALEFALHVHKPDGIAPALSDGDARNYLDLLRQGHALYGRDDMLYVATGGAEGRSPGQRSVAFPDAGYYILRSGWGEQADAYADERYLVFDCGPLGAGNHGHLDLLSFELAAYGRSLIVDPGRYTYSEAGEVNWRVRFRGTGYHNTVQVDGKNQTRYVPVPRKPRYKIKGPAPDHRLAAFETEPGFDYLHGVAESHEYGAVHERRIMFVAGEYWLIADSLSADETHRYDLLLHLSERAQGRCDVVEERGMRLLRSPNLLIAQIADPAVGLTVDPGYVSYRYGEKHPAPVARFTQRAQNASFLTLLYPYRDRPPEVTVRALPLEADEKTQAHARAVSIDVEREDVACTDYCFFSGPGSMEQSRFAGYHYDGAYLLLRETEDKKITRLHLSSGTRLHGPQGPVPVPPKGI